MDLESKEDLEITRENLRALQAIYFACSKSRACRRSSIESLNCSGSD
jgi:hypothetical protein